MNSPNRSTLRAWFAFGLRLLGFWEIITAASYFLTALNISMGYTKPFAGQASFGSYATQVFGHLILALFLLKWAPNIAAFVYTEPRPREDSFRSEAFGFLAPRSVAVMCTLQRGAAGLADIYKYGFYQAYFLPDE